MQSISAYHHWCCEFESRSGQGVQHYVIKFVNDLRQVGGDSNKHMDIQFSAYEDTLLKWQQHKHKGDLYTV